MKAPTLITTATLLLPSLLLTLAWISLTLAVQGIPENPDDPLDTRGVPASAIWTVIIAMLGAPSIALSSIANFLANKTRHKEIGRSVSLLANLPTIATSLLGLFVTTSYGSVSIATILPGALFLASAAASSILIRARFKAPSQ
ncbi:hypothetical protein LOY34_02215 [Pseudomonas sp. B21-009]|uniref:hypothetical protein n=1 Tax=Pseudomonas sp. B21-009 TaxID=2895470 RepID=UPI002160CB68|nr:hypothetical protein [Pseudomonas sp. B21-009]UVM67370.1 hypothetical protein LOY34_02215 [Pseudomonas sp. B21-009]